MSDMSKTPRLPLDEWLRAAYDPEASDAGCPPPEAFLEEEMASLSPAERRALETHADRCPACAAERDLARLFDAAPEEAAVRPEDLSFVVSRLEKAEPVRPVSPNVVPFAPPRKERKEEAPRSRSLFRLAAAAVLVIGAGLGYQAFHAPSSNLPALPAPAAPGSAGVMRGSEVEAVAPLGEVAEIPRQLRWVPVAGAGSYRLRITAVDGTVLWAGTAPSPPALLPADVAGRLHRAVLYSWTVEALDPSGARLASSEPVHFKVRLHP
jgi:hypothetical protein